MTIQFKIQNSHLIIINGVEKLVKLPYPVYKVEAFDECLVVLLIGEDGYFPMNENIFGVSFEGKILWQIEKVRHIREDSPYTNIWKQEDGKLGAFNWDGHAYTLNPLTGEILNRYFMK